MSTIALSHGTPRTRPRSSSTHNSQAIVGIEIVVDRVEAKAKISQNRPEQDRLGVLDGLAADPHQDAAPMVRAMRHSGQATS